MKNKICTTLAIFATATALLLPGARTYAAVAAKPPPVLIYQGSVFVDEKPFEGTGYFKLAIVDSDGATLWSNDGTSVSGSEPSAAISVTITKGIVQIPLGDTSVSGMDLLDPAIFNTAKTTYLRTWFDDGAHGFAELVPSIRIASTVYAFNTDFLDGYSSEDFFRNDQQVSSSQIAPSAVGTVQIAASSVTPDKITAFSNNSTVFTIGSGAVSTNVIYANQGAANNPGLRFDSGTNKWQISNDGTTWSDIGTGSGSGTVNAGAINELAWYQAAGTAVSGLATAANGALVTSAGGVPSISSTLPAAVQGNITGVGTIISGVWNGTAVDNAHVADDLTIVGGTVNNTPIGAVTANTGNFTTLTAQSLATSAQGAISIGPYGVGAGNTGELRLQELLAGGVNYVGLKAPDAIAANQIWALPAADGAAGNVLSTNGSGVLSWAAAAAGDVVGPAGGATDNAVARYDTASGKLIQNSGVIIDDANNVTGVAALSISSMGANWTNAGRTIADLGSVTTADINGGSIDNTTIGAATAAGGTFTSLESQTSKVTTSAQMEDPGAGTNTITLQAPNGLAPSYTLTLPADDGAATQVLQTNGSGVLSWTTPASGTVTAVTASAPLASSDGATPDISFTGTLAIGNGGTNATTAQNARTSLGLAIGTDVEAWDAQLDDIAALAVTDGNFIVGDGTNWVAESGATARASLGLGSIATQAANNVAITGGAIDGTAIGGTTTASGKFTTIDSSGQYTNTVAGGTAPMVITSSTLVGNLNSDYLDGQHGSYYLDLVNATIASQAQGDILYYDGSNWARLPAGTSGQFLQTQGGGADPKWAATAASGVSSLDSLTGALTLANSSGAGSTVTIDDATNAAKGIASFNSTNFTVASGAVNTVQNIASSSSPSFTGLTVSGLSTAGVVHNNASGVLSTSTVSLTADVSGTLPIANGGTNGTASPTNGGVTYGTGTAYAFTAAGTSGQVLTSNGAAAPTWQAASGGVWTRTGTNLSPTTGGDDVLLNNGETLTLSSAANTATISGSTVTSNYTLSLPPDDGTANQVLTTDGSGVLSWTSATTPNMDATYNNFGAALPTIVVDAAQGQLGPLTFQSNAASTTGNIAIDLNSTGDFIIKDAGTAFVTFNDNQTTDFAANVAADRVIDVTQGGNGGGVMLANAGTGSGIYIDQNGNTGAANDTGSLAVENTGQTDRALSIYTNQNAAQAQSLVQVFVDNAAFDEKTVAIRNDGTNTALEVDTNTGPGTGAPMRLVPSATPTTNLAGGQLFFDTTTNLLYYYDSSRSKWLSVEGYNLEFGTDGNSDGAALAYGGDMININAGARMPYAGTIVYVTAMQNGGLATKQFDVQINGATSFSFSLVGSVYTTTTQNTNFAAGDYLGVATNAAGAAATDPSCILFVKWRK